MTTFRNLRDFNISTINQDSKITILKESDFGYPIAIQIKVSGVIFKDYAQYKDCLYIIGTPKGKRKQFGYLLKPNDSFSIFAGFVEVNKTSTDNVKDGYTITSFGRCFDKDILIQASDIEAELLYSTL